MSPVICEPLAPTFDEAQALFSSYSVLESNLTLRQKFLDIISHPLSIQLLDDNVRRIYNDIILKYYHNEATVKSSFINQELLTRKNHITIFELPVGNSRIDLCKINGTSIAFEIKTDLDDLSRLNKQLSDYSEIFEKTYVICSKKKLAQIENVIEPCFGIYVYSQNKNFKIKFNRYRAASVSNRINPKMQLLLFQKKELLNILPQAQYESKNVIIENILKKNSPQRINALFKSTLKARYARKWGFLHANHENIFEIDYQWFYKNEIAPELIYR